MGRSLVYLLEVFVLLWAARMAYRLVYRRVDLNRELFQSNNHALAVATAGYLLGIVIALGGVLSGPSAGFLLDIRDIAVYGAEAIVLMLVAGFLCERVLLPDLDNSKEVVDKHNMGAAFVEAGMHIANGLIVLAINQGEAPWWVALVFWALAQLGLLIVGKLYDYATPHSIHAELRRGNAAVGLAFAGVLVGMGNIISISTAGDFDGWRQSLTYFGTDAAFGLLVLLIVKKIADVILAPGVRLGAEEVEAEPNMGAGLLEATGYLCGSLLVAWVL